MSKRILIIEDEEHLGKAIEAFLAEHSYDAVYISKGINDIGDIRKVKPDLILTDLLLPGLHGFDICKSVKEDPELNNTPLIIMTAVYKNAIHKLEARRLGVNDFVEKPLNFDELLKKIELGLGTTSKVASTVDIKESNGQADTPAPESPSKIPEMPTSIPEEEDLIGGKEFQLAIPSTDKLDPIKDTSEQKPKPTVLVELPQEQEVKGDSEDGKDTAILKHFRKLQEEYAAKLPGKIIEMEKTWADVEASEDTMRQLAKIRRQVHSLAGSGTTFGYKDISDLARELELTLDMIIAEGEETINKRKDKVIQLLDNMRHHPMISTELEIMRMSGKK